MSIVVKSIFLSDIHLGAKYSQTDKLKSFLSEYQSENLFLVGDIFDFWEFKQKRIHWTQSTTNIVRMILGKAKHGTIVYYISGNHDEELRLIDELDLGNIKLKHEVIYTTLTGRRCLIIHGDMFDAYMTFLKNHKIIDWLVG
jgi:UDP-2,3-diacylglucosamine pyrophosphatase LpxH